MFMHISTLPVLPHPLLNHPGHILPLHIHPRVPGLEPCAEEFEGQEDVGLNKFIVDEIDGVGVTGCGCGCGR